MKHPFFLLTLFVALLCACDKNYEPEVDSIGTLPGKFSVNNGKQVQFSRGNLQYVGTWQFAEYQWDSFGSDQSDNHRDLFGWGTGNDPQKVSTDNNDYATFSDWGANTITNGGQTAKQWRTLTKDEWVYLFFTRENATTLFALGSVNGVNGIIILPDSWELPAGASFTASTKQGLANNGNYYKNAYGNNFSDNTYNITQWSVMESAGAVFLPVAGYRNGTGVLNARANGYYWSATPDGGLFAYDIDFDSSYIGPQNGKGRSGGRSVRLVR